MISRPSFQLLSPFREHFNLTVLTLSFSVPKKFDTSNFYSTEGKASATSEVEEKRKKFIEVESKHEELLQFDKLSEDEKKIHALHAEAVQRGHFTYDDPVTGEKVVTRLRHFLKGKCCGKSCRHCIYEHIGVLDEEKKSRAWFNSSFWQYKEDLEDNSLAGFEDHDVVTYGRGPYPRKYAQRANTSMFHISPSNDSKPRN